MNIAGTSNYLQIERGPSPADGRCATFWLAGELDIANVDLLVQTVVSAASESDRLVLDLSRLEFMDCSGIRALVRILDAIGRDGRLFLRRPLPPVKMVLDLVGADRFEGLEIQSS